MFDIAHIPFSRAGRWLTLSVLDGGLWLRSVRGGDLRPSLGRLCAIEFRRDGAAVTPDMTLTPQCLRATAGDAWAEFAIGDGECLHLRGKGLSVHFSLTGSRYDYAYRTAQGEECLVAAYENTRLMPRGVAGTVTVSGTWRRDHSENVAMVFDGPAGFEGTVTLFTAVPPAAPDSSFDAALAAAGDAFEAWLARVPATGRCETTRRLAAYVLWANIVPVEGLLSRPAIYMSKNTMINVWSWDNAFSALGIAAIDPALAFDQLAVIFDHQHESGLLPDFVNDRDASFAFTKPPVHGWAVARLAGEYPGFLSRTRRRYLARHIAAQVTYWLTQARADASTLPAYAHGNDSGWDNASFFAEGGPVIAPDLATFLILACDLLAEIDGDAQWAVTADGLTAQLLACLWNGETFGTRLLADPAHLRSGQSLIQFIPLLLGPRLPEDVVAALLRRLQAPGYLTEWGPATENTGSPHYQPDGYWRGPVWAPTSYLLWDGLRAQGQTALADLIAARFCAACEISGMAENFDAITGRGLRDRAFAWTSAVYLRLAATLGAQ